MTVEISIVIGIHIVIDSDINIAIVIPSFVLLCSAITDPERSLDLQTDKLHLLSGGTKIVQDNPPPKEGSGLTATDNGCLAYVIRTGFNTSKG